MAESNPYQNINYNQNQFREKTVTSVWVPPPPPLPSPLNNSSSFVNENSRTIPISRTYKSELYIDRTPATVIKFNQCYKCGNIINENIENSIKFNEKFYHKNCLKCFQCEKSLIDLNNIYEKDMKIYCEQCYQQKFSFICQKCFQTILNEEYKIFQGKKFHNNCLKCFYCQNILHDKQISIINSNPICSKCYEESFASKCYQCSKVTLQGKSVIYNENKYHPECFRCQKCDQIINDQTFHQFNSKPSCSKCYEESFASKCYQCSKAILQGKSVIYNENKYHPECFRCQKCNEIINERKFQLENNKICCLNCYEKFYLKKCFKCGKEIIDRYTTYQGNSYHLFCFTCSKCYQIISDNEKFYQDKLNILCSKCQF